jgi:hypothetical protein
MFTASGNVICNSSIVGGAACDTIMIVGGVVLYIIMSGPGFCL